MCCKTSVHPLDTSLAVAILTVGQFKPAMVDPDAPDIARTWRREIPEEDATVTVSIAGGSFEINITPSISCFEHHIGKRVTASVYFEIAAKYAEKVGGEIVQRATVVGCKTPEQGLGLVVARYPHQPMDFTRVCAGFQSVLLDHPDMDSRIA